MSDETKTAAAEVKPRENPYRRNLQVTDEFMQKYSFKRQGQDVVLVKGLMHLAHELGFQSVKTRFVQFPCQENDWTAFAETEVIDEFGRVWINGGDASPKNVGKQVAPHYPRMALTRSQGRALRDALGLQLLVDEELEVMAEVARGANLPHASREQYAQIKQLRTQKGKDSDYIIDLAWKLFEKAPGELHEGEADVILMILQELPDADVPAQQEVATA